MKSILLIGLGRFGRHIAQELNELGHQVMAIDSNEDRVNAVLSYVTNAQIGDSTSEYFLRSLGVGNFDVCIVTIGGNFQSSLETTSLLKELGAKLIYEKVFYADVQTLANTFQRVQGWILNAALNMPNVCGIHVTT